MLAFFQIFKNMANQLAAENLHRVILVLVALILLGSTAFMLCEPNLGFMDSLWWSIVTVTTVGYGDISPATLGGRLVGVLLMMMGIGFLGILTATIAGIFVENKIMENRGRKPVNTAGHYVICGWNYGGRTIVSELRNDVKSKNATIVVIAELDEKPVEDKNLCFIHGEINKEVLAKASLDKAVSAIVLADERLDLQVRDAKSMLNTLTIKSLYPDLYVCVQLMEAKNVEHCRMAKADEIIVVGSLSTNLVVRATLDHGITGLITELVSQAGQELYKVDVPPSLAGQTFIEAVMTLKKSQNVMCLGVESKSDFKLTANPDADYRLGPDDQLLVMAVDRPHLT